MRKSGASLIWAIVVSSALMFIAATTANFVIKESQMSIRMDDSSRAYAAAESGIEWGKYCISSSMAECRDGVVSGPYIFNLEESTYRVTFDRSGTKDNIYSQGTSNGVNRKLEYVITPNNTLTIVPNPIAGNYIVNGSYVQQFDYWNDGNAGFAKIGLGNSTGTRAIYMEHNGNDFYLVAKSGATIKSSNDNLQKVNISSAELRNPEGAYALRVRIEYFKDLSAKMTISRRNFGTGPAFTCVSPILVLDLRNFITTSDLTNFYYGGLVVEPAPSKGDGTGTYVIKYGASEAYFDTMATRNISPKLTATGGTITRSGAYTIHTFTGSGTFQVLSGSGSVEVLIVGGGGSGGGSAHANGGGGGGGAGGVIYTTASVTTQAYPVQVGAGGNGVSNNRGNNGQNSIFAGLIALGGGGGGSGYTVDRNFRAGLNGGSGGGAGYNVYIGAAVGLGTAGQGHDGGQNGGISLALLQWAGGGGGGGAGSVGGTGRVNHAGGIGGTGVTYNISGSNQTYAVGGNGGDIGVAPTVAAPNTGNGSSGGYGDNTTSGAGGSGIVIIRYLTP